MTGGGRLHGSDVHRLVARWFAENIRQLPWRTSSPWGVLVSEVMLQQTPVARVLPRWQEWMSRWPTPADLAAAPTAEVLRAWDRLGYPRRALRLKEAAATIAVEHDNEVPDNEEQLRALPGVGEYTAAAVIAFAHRRRAVVLDTNIRRVLARADQGSALPAPSLSRAERQRAEHLLPADPETSAQWNAGVMELGALVCTARAPRCSRCPLRAQCAWLAAGKPADAFAARRRSQAWQGTDRKARGQVMAVLRSASAPVTTVDLARAWPAQEQRERVLAGLVADGLAVATDTGYVLPQ